MNKYLIALILSSVTVYAIMSFIAMSLNPYYWNIWLRVIFSVMVLSAFITYKNDLRS